jgi:hypothetical protein
MGAQLQEKVFNVLVEKDEDGYYVGSVVELPRVSYVSKDSGSIKKQNKGSYRRLSLGFLEETQVRVCWGATAKAKTISLVQIGLRPAKIRDVVKALGKLGFRLERIQGSHRM